MHCYHICISLVFISLPQLVSVGGRKQLLQVYLGKSLRLTHSLVCVEDERPVALIVTPGLLCFLFSGHSSEGRKEGEGGGGRGEGGKE